MPVSAKLPYVFYTLEVDRAYWLSLRGNDPDYDAGSRGYTQTVNKVASRFPLPSQLEPSNISSYENGLSGGIGSWLSKRQYSPGTIRLYTEPKSSNLKKLRYVIAEIRNL
jgi:hypothetical protein